MRAEDLRDISGLGGLPLFAVTASFALASGEQRFVASLAGALVLGYAATVLLKSLHFRARPEPQPYANALERFDANSFPSIHAMRGTVFWALVATRVQRPVLVLVSAFVVIGIAGTRVLLKRHHVTDVIVGIVTGVGAVCVAVTLTERWIA